MVCRFFTSSLGLTLPGARECSAPTTCTPTFLTQPPELPRCPAHLRTPVASTGTGCHAPLPALRLAVVASQRIPVVTHLLSQMRCVAYQKANPGMYCVSVAAAPLRNERHRVAVKCVPCPVGCAASASWVCGCLAALPGMGPGSKSRVSMCSVQGIHVFKFRVSMCDSA